MDTSLKNIMDNEIIASAFDGIDNRQVKIYNDNLTDTKVYTSYNRFLKSVDI